jgi:hypothetical protein
MICRQFDPIVHMLKLLYDLGVISHMEIGVNVVVSPVAVLGSLEVEDFTNPLIDVTIYE